MKKIRENELSQNLQEFQNTNLEIEFENEISGTLKLINGKVNFNNTDGYIYIECEEGNLKINTTLVMGYEKQNNVIRIKFETLVLNIKK